MDNKNMLISGVVGALVMVVLSNVPILNLINCLLCAGVWLGGMAAVWFYRRQTGRFISAGQGALLGAVAGVLAAIVGSIISSITGPAAIQSVIDADPSGQMADALGGFATGGMTVFSVIMNLIIYPLFGAIGGAIYATLTKPKAPPAPPAM